MSSSSDPSASSRARRSHQRAIGISLAAAVVCTWTVVHITAVFTANPARMPLWSTIAIIALQTWLCVGLFIVAHDAMHGSLAPGWPRLNRLIGRLALALYAGFSYDRFLPKHFDHHRYPGTAADPDFAPAHPRRFWPWLGVFFAQHVGWREIAAQTAIVAVYVFGFGVPFPNLLLFWAAPALLAAVQLFYFGTYRPHRHDTAPFTDRHRTRSDGFPSWLSLLTCFHFGYHHEHHLAPQVPWWNLPRFRRARGG